MLTRDIVREIKSVKGVNDFRAKLSSIWTGQQPPSEFNRLVTDAIIYAAPHLAPILALTPITNGTANAVASKLDR